MDALGLAFSQLASPGVLAAAFGGVLWGILGGALPGISPSIAMALLLPFTVGLDPTNAIVLLASTWFLEDRTGPPSQRELADHAGTDAMMTSQVLRSLEADGLVERRPDPHDARVKRLRTTEAGRTVAASALAVIDELDRRFFGPAGDRAELVELLRALAGRDDEGNLLDPTAPD